MPHNADKFFCEQRTELIEQNSFSRYFG